MAVTGMTVGRVRTVGSVASVPGDRYTGNMPKERGLDEMTSRDAAALLGVTTPRFYELVNEGKIHKHYRPFAKRPHYSKKELLALLAEEEERSKGADAAQS